MDLPHGWTTNTWMISATLMVALGGLACGSGTGSSGVDAAVSATDAAALTGVIDSARAVDTVRDMAAVPADASARPDLGGDGPRTGAWVTVLAKDQISARSIVVDKQNIYWLDFGTRGAHDGALRKVSLSGGKPVTLVDGLDVPSALAVDANNLYWGSPSTTTNIGIEVAGTGSLMKVAIAGGPPTALATGLYWLGSIAVDAEYVYWTGSDGGVLNSSGTVMKVPIAGGDPTLIAKGQISPKWIKVVDKTLYWGNMGNNPDNIGTVMSFLLPDNGLTEIAKANTLLAAMDVWGNKIYYGTYGSGGVIYSFNPDGATSAPLVPSVPVLARMKVDGSGIYYTAGGNLWRVGLEGGPVMDIQPHPTIFEQGRDPSLAMLAVTDMAFDETTIYFAGDRLIWKMPK
jgi:hypothetical protein